MLYKKIESEKLITNLFYVTILQQWTMLSNLILWKKSYQYQKFKHVGLGHKLSLSEVELDLWVQCVFIFILISISINLNFMQICCNKYSKARYEIVNLKIILKVYFV